MGFELDKHDLFRHVVPGAVFLLVISSFFFVKHNFSFDALKDVGSLSILFGIAITLPLGYVIHNIYRALHVWLELYRWYKFENKRLQDLVKGEKVVAKLKGDRLGSWFVECCLHIDSSSPLRERGYQMLSRVHSAGGSIM